MSGRMTVPDRCFGAPGAETMESEIEDVLSTELGIDFPEDVADMSDDQFPVEIEEWTTRTGRDLLPARERDEARREAEEWREKWCLETVIDEPPGAWPLPWEMNDYYS